MKSKIFWLILIVVVISGCGGGGSNGSSSSFDASDNAPVVDNITTSTEQNITSIIKEEDGKYIVHVNENQRTVFKVNALDQSELTYSLSGEDWRLFDIDRYNGEFYFKEFTDFEKKKEYHITLLIHDSIGHVAKKEVTIYVIDMENEPAPIVVVNSNEPLEIDDEKRYFITTWRTDINDTLHPNMINIPTIGDGYYYSVDWGDGTSSKNVREDINHTYSTAGVYQVKILGDFPRIYFGGGLNWDGNYTSFSPHYTILPNNKKILSVDQWGDINWSSMRNAFEECENLEILASDRPNLYNVKDMSHMFYNAKKFNQDIGDWDVSGVNNMAFMFASAESFNQDIGNWDVSNVTNMYSMFKYAKSFNQNIENWDIYNVEDMRYMFKGATSLEVIPYWYHE
jgi:surface protein